MDFEGDGVVDYTGADFEELSHIYDVEGIYYPAVIVTESNGNANSDTVAINVINKAQLDLKLQEKWDGMKGALANGDVEKAVSNFASDTREAYGKQFTALSAVLPAIANEFNNSPISLVKAGSNYATYEIIVTRAGKALSFSLQFIKDVNGLWKIWRF